MRSFCVFSFFFLVVVVSSACVVDLPVQLSLPAAEVDLDEARVAFEARVCGDVGSDDCAVLDALDRVDGAAATPTALPELLPAFVDVRRLDDSVDVDRWFDDKAFATDELSPARRIPLELPPQIDADALAELDVDAAAVVFSGSTLTIDVPDFDVYVGNGDGDDGAFIGVDEGGVVSFADGGVAALRGVLALADGWLELRPQTPATLRPQGDGFVRPGGRADVVVDLTVRFPVQLSARPATSAQE